MRTGDVERPALDREPAATDGESRLNVLDRALYALFAANADADRHADGRDRYRATDLRVGFDVYLARVYGLAWATALAVVIPALVIALAVPSSAYESLARVLRAAVPLTEGLPPLSPPRPLIAVGVAAGLGATVRRVVIAVGGAYLGWRAKARRADIERTLPGAARYLHALSSGTDGPREMLRKVADSDAYGETAVAVRKALNTAALTGSFGEGLRRVARDTPSRDALAPFLLKFREHAEQGEDALAAYLRMESRMLGHRRERARERAEGFMELLAEVFVVLLVLPALLVIVLTVMSVLAPGLSAPVDTPLGTTTTRAVAVYCSAGFVLLVGAGSALVVDSLRPADQQTTYERPESVAGIFGTALENPASGLVVALVPAVAVAALVHLLGAHPVDSLLAGYVALAIPVGLVALRRSRVDDAKDREIKDFVHAVSGHVALGRPFPAAVKHVASDVDLGPLNEDVADLAFNLGLATGVEDGAGRRSAALSRFVDRVGTPLAEQTMGLVTGALEAGSDSEAVFETLQTEVGRLYHEKRALRSSMSVYVAVGWTTALLVTGITVAVNEYVLSGFTQLSATGGGSGFALDPNAIDPERDRFRFYAVAQATMLASGWFAGAASRGAYAALLHSGSLVVACHLVFAGVAAL